MVDYRLELVIIPVTDVDRAVAFYGETLGWPVDFNQVVSPELRFVQVTPPGSACSIAFGVGLLPAEAKPLLGLQLVTPDADAAHDDLVARGIEVGPVQDLAWGRFVWFDDPDGNHWAVQQLPLRNGSV
ncbi:VOC family protein [Lysinimonas soli]|uniref:VOC family protein n=1 Tax=Lysinimonas soli TaxID=1074233 RepID=A0ABW0NQU1_9MICO